MLKSFLNTTMNDSWVLQHQLKNHPHTQLQAFMKKVEEFEVSIVEPDEVETVTGQGIKAMVNGEHYVVDNEKSIEHIEISGNIKEEIRGFKEEGITIVLDADNKEVLGLFGISDEIREESKEVVQSLHRVGITNTIMLTGDHQKTAEKVANAVGVTQNFGNLLPEDKVDKVNALTQKGMVAIIGDGINDAPALATADLGIAMGKGTDRAIETADIVLMQDHLGKLPSAISIAKSKQGY